MNQFLKKYLFELLLVLLAVVLFITNYVHGTYLMGWDNVQTDLNSWLGVKRALFSVWEEYQSFGLVAGNAHAADLVRSIFIWFLSFVMPQNIIRYFFHILMLLIGGLGMLKLLASLGFKDEKKPLTFLGSLFYMLNFGTVQIFYLPYEAFSLFFAALPWEIWIFTHLLDFLKKHRFSAIPKKDLFLFLGINFLATSQNFIQTIFVVYMILIGIILLVTSLEKKSFAVLLKGSILCAIIVVINSFWILPQVYFLKTSGNVVKEAKTNIVATSETVYQNKEKGTIADFIKMEGFYNDLADANHQQLFAPWQKHFQQPFFAVLPYLMASIVLLGLLSKRRFHSAFLALYFLIAVALLSATIPFSIMNDILRKSDFINQIFRSPFTKFIIPYSLVASYLFTSGLSGIVTFMQQHKLLKHVQKRSFYAVIFFIITLSAFPVFTGNFFSREMKVTVPKDYFELFQYFNHQNPNSRVALLPEYTIWGWFFTKWGFNGSGFLWYGMEQPIVSRTFDVWSNKSEGYYWEMKSALESENVETIENVLEKYNIDYLVLDSSLLPVSSTTKAMQLDRTTALLKAIQNIHLAKKTSILSIYSVTHPKKIKDFSAATAQLPNIGPTIKVTNTDTAYQNSGDYKTDATLPYDGYYPFLDFMTETRIANSSWQITEDSSHFYLTSKVDNQFLLSNVATQLPTTFSSLYSSSHQYTDPLPVSLKGGILKITVQKRLIDSFTPEYANFVECEGVKGSHILDRSKNGVTITSADKANICFSYVDADLEQRFGYLVKVTDKNYTGPHLYFYISDKTKKQTQVEDRLLDATEYYILPTRYDYGVGYDFVFHNDSYQNTTSKNTLSGLQIYKLPYTQIRAIQLIQQATTQPKTTYIDNLLTKKQNLFLYKMQLDTATTNGADLILYQAYHSGWKAYQVNKATFLATYFPFIFGTQLSNHFPVNNWANGWRVPAGSSNTIIVIFWPQYLEYTGFVLLILLFIWSRFHQYALRSKDSHQ